MKVKELIAMLNELPKNLHIYIADHDHGKYETSSSAHTCELINKANMNEFENDKHKSNGDQPFINTPKKYVVIRP